MVKFLHIVLILGMVRLFAQQGTSEFWSQAEQIPKFNSDFHARGTSGNNMVVLNDGSIFMVYNEFREPERYCNTYYIISEDGNIWSEPELFQPGVSIAGNSVPVIGVDNQNTIHFIWHTKKNRSLYYCNYKEGIFSSPTRVSATEKYVLENKNLTIDKLGRLHIFWEDDNIDPMKGTEIYYTRSVDGGRTFTKVRMISNNDEFNSFLPAADFSGTASDNLAITWLVNSDSENSSDGKIMMAVSEDGGDNWKIDPQFSMDKETVINSHLSVDRRGAFILSYSRKISADDEKYLISFSTSFNEGASWSDPVDLSTKKLNSESQVYKYNFADDIHWIFWTEQSEYSANDKHLTVYASYSTDSGINWIHPEKVSEFNYSDVEITSAWINDDGFLGINYDILDTMTGLYSIAFQLREPVFVHNMRRTEQKENRNRLVSVHPNPAIGEITVTFNCEKEGTYEVGIFNILGEKIMNEEKYFGRGIGQISFNLNGLLPGIYLYTVVGNDKVITGKITKVAY